MIHDGDGKQLAAGIRSGCFHSGPRAHGKLLLLTGLVIASMLGFFSARTVGQAPSAKVDFQREVLPILSDRCYLCHGPDEGTRQADLRLDQRDGLLEHVQAGSAEDSELWYRIGSDDESEVMPPPESKLSLTDVEKSLIRKWIEEGADWNRHWSLEPLPRVVNVPEVNSPWPVNPIDRFVFARLESAGLKPTAAAPRWRWIRRVTFDLTGLPPTPDEIADFESDETDQAFEKVVDRLLASPRFGEHMAISWLDAARFADSYGYQSDLLSPTWPWRDWVVRAINCNLSYDRFLTWQLAGDMLPDATTDQILATAFNRLHRMTNEGGSIELEWHTEYVADRVNTFGTAILGMTFECARCHDHKFDAITQQDYYNLFAFLNNIDEWGMYNDSSRVPTPSLLLPNDAQQSSINTARIAYENAAAEADAHRQSVIKANADLLMPGELTLQLAPIAAFDFDAMESDRWLANNIRSEQRAENSGGNVLVPGKTGQGIQFTGDDAVGIADLATGLNPWERFAVAMWIRIPNGRDEAVLLHHTGGTDVGFFGTDLSLVGGRFRLSMIRFWPGNALAIESRNPAVADQWTHVVISNDATGSADGLQLYVDGVLANGIVRDNLTKRPDAGGSGFSLGARFRSAGFEGGIMDELQVFDRPLSPVEVRLLSRGLTSIQASEFTRQELCEHQLLVNPQYNELAALRGAAYKGLLDAQTDVMEVPVMRELENVRPAWNLARGNYDAPRTDDNLARREAPSALPPLRQGTRRDRLGLAKWLTQADHPLTARVAVNRLWSNFFGRGLVQSMNDFGVQGHRPTHPELLDWLARDFVDSGWDVKQFCRQVTLSSSYRQDSSASAQAWNDDPHNEVLARGPARRLSAEMIRDTALFIAGLLNSEMGGPPVSPYQPQDLWREDNTMTPAYQQSVGTALYRRSLYTVWKRTAPIPNMLLFDAGGREVCSMSRSTTNTPLQAMVLLNDPQFVEAARVMAEQILIQFAEDTEKAIGTMFLRATARQPDPRELLLLNELFRDQLDWFEEHPDEAGKLLNLGEHVHDTDLDRAKTAALTVVAQAVLGSDAAIWKR